MPRVWGIYIDWCINKTNLKSLAPLQRGVVTPPRKLFPNWTKAFLRTTHDWRIKFKRTYDKKNCCLYCTKEFGKLARHLEQVHHNEEEVQVALSFPKSDKRRKEQFTKLRKMANFNHNMVVLETNKSELKVDRRPTETIDPTQYLPCKKCNEPMKNTLSSRCYTSPTKRFKVYFVNIQSDPRYYF